MRKAHLIQRMMMMMQLIPYGPGPGDMQGVIA